LRKQQRPPPKDPFNEVDFGSYFQEYLDPGYRTQPEYEDSEKPSFENFLSQPTTLADHLAWQLGSLTLEPALGDAAEFVIGNLDEDGYLAASEEELAALFKQISGRSAGGNALENGDSNGTDGAISKEIELVRRGIDLVQHLDPAGIGARDLRECLLIQIAAQQQEFAQIYSRQHNGQGEEDPHGSFRSEAEARLEERRRAMEVAGLIVDGICICCRSGISKTWQRRLKLPLRRLTRRWSLSARLDPRPGRQYNREQTRLIEPDVVFVKRGGEWVVSMNEEDLPSLRLSRRYRQMLLLKHRPRGQGLREGAVPLSAAVDAKYCPEEEHDLRTCEVIVRRQQDFLEQGIESLRPMMIKEVAEEIGVHASTVSRAVANKYAHTPQGVIELRFFFSEGSNGPEGADTPLAGAQAQGAEAH